MLFGNDKDIAGEYRNTFVGMTVESVALERLLETRSRLRVELPARLTSQHRRFLVGLARAQPDWSLLNCAHAAQLPAVRWKLTNLHAFQRRRLRDFESQARLLEERLGEIPDA